MWELKDTLSHGCLVGHKVEFPAHVGIESITNEAKECRILVEFPAHVGIESPGWRRLLHPRIVEFPAHVGIESGMFRHLPICMDSRIPRACGN